MGSALHIAPIVVCPIWSLSASLVAFSLIAPLCLTIAGGTFAPLLLFTLKRRVGSPEAMRPALDVAPIVTSPIKGLGATFVHFAFVRPFVLAVASGAFAPFLLLPSQCGIRMSE